MSYLTILAEDRDLILYRKSLRRLTGSVTSTLLLQQILYWSKIKKYQPFYKFKLPCDHEQYAAGDSWVEELGFSEGEFDTAIKYIATKLTKGQKATDIATDPDAPIEEQAKHLVIYWTDIQRRTWYWLNIPVADRLISFIYDHPDFKVAKPGNTLLRNLGIPGYVNPKTPDYVTVESTVTYGANEPLVYTETTTETTTEIEKGAAAPAFEGNEENVFSIQEQPQTQQQEQAPLPPVASAPLSVDYSTLTEHDPRRIEHEALLGLTTRAKHYNPDLNHQIIVSDGGMALTEKLRASLVNALIPVRKAEKLMELANEEDLLDLQRLAAQLYQMGVDTPEKITALGALWDESNKIPPRGRLLVKFASEVYADRLAEKKTPANGVSNVSKNGGRGGHKVSQLDAFIAGIGAITAETKAPRDIESWPTTDRTRFYELKYSAPPVDLAQLPTLFDGGDQDIDFGGSDGADQAGYGS